jgi:single-stranded-DNA-specific exonuclease
LTRVVRRTTAIDPDELPTVWHPVVRRVLAARGIASADDLDMRLAGLANPNRMTDGPRAAGLIADVIQAGGRILVVGDFDADGATSCALAVRALRALGALSASYLVPNRFEYGYGLSPEIAAIAAEKSPDLVITVDNGITSHAGVSALEQAGIPVVVTDHHLPADSLPDASAVVDPNRADDPHPGTSLAGVGVVFHVMLGVRAYLREQGWFASQDEPALAELLDLVALGTVADVVALDRTNRILVEQGLRRIRAGVGVPGIRALLERAGRDAGNLSASDLGYAVAPRLNAAGRLDDMTVGIECLLADDMDHAGELATSLDGLNRERQRIEGRMRDEAIASVETLRGQFDDGTLPAGLCVSSADWHEGIVGIVAGRLKDYFRRPVVALAPSGDGEALKGSARSIAGVHMRDVLASVDARYPGVIQRFGGHAMAAGLTIPWGCRDDFETAFTQVVAEWVSPEILQGCLYDDGALAPEDFTQELAATLRTFAPWGEGFPEPVFSNHFRIQQRRVVGDRHLKMVVLPEGDGPSVEAIAFNALDYGWDSVGPEAMLTYRLDINRYRGRERLQLVVEDIQDTRHRSPEVR